MPSRTELASASRFLVMPVFIGTFWFFGISSGIPPMGVCIWFLVQNFF